MKKKTIIIGAILIILLLITGTFAYGAITYLNYGKLKPSKSCGASFEEKISQAIDVQDISFCEKDLNLEYYSSYRYDIKNGWGWSPPSCTSKIHNKHIGFIIYSMHSTAETQKFHTKICLSFFAESLTNPELLSTPDLIKIYLNSPSNEKEKFLNKIIDRGDDDSKDFIENGLYNIKSYHENSDRDVEIILDRFNEIFSREEAESITLAVLNSKKAGFHYKISIISALELNDSTEDILVDCIVEEKTILNDFTC